jgi:UPF0755 protein
VSAAPPKKPPADEAPKRGRKLLWLSLAVCVAVAGAGAAWWLKPGSRRVQIEVPAGSTAKKTAVLLEREGVIRSALVFRVFAKLSGLDRSLKPGLYVLPKPISGPQAVMILSEGRIKPTKVVIPEGFMAKQIADRLEANEVIADAGEFMKYVREHDLEGFLFPTTYHFARGLPAEAVAEHMFAEFQKRIVPKFNAVKQDRFSLRQVVTLASIVQREARVVDEMPEIASVYSNRLRKRMRLEADPTVQYAMGKETGEWFKGLRFKHLDIHSPYNTYRFFGLPKGPICSPGEKAVEASIAPKATKYIYFVADIDGRHLFSETFAQHQRYIDKVKAKKRKLKWQRNKKK